MPFAGVVGFLPGNGCATLVIDISSSKLKPAYSDNVECIEECTAIPAIESIRIMYAIFDRVIRPK